jgi:hypothetical protein
MTDTPDEVYNKYWKHIVENEDGTINLEQLKKELFDFTFVMTEVSKVYWHITGGLLSECNYKASVVIDTADEHYGDMYAS